MKKLLYFFELKSENGAKINCDGAENNAGSLADEHIIYRVEENESIEKIALKLNCPPSVIVSENRLSEEVRAGDLLAVKIGYTELYRIKPEDDIAKLTELSNLSAKQLLEINRVSYFYPWQLIALGVNKD